MRTLHTRPSAILALVFVTIATSFPTARAPLVDETASTVKRRPAEAFQARSVLRHFPGAALARSDRFTVQDGQPILPGDQVFVIGSVPPQNIRYGQTLTFRLRSSALGPATFGYTIDPGYEVPQGAISLDVTSGLFSYTPALADNFEFRLTFSSLADTNRETQSVAITAVGVPPETDVIPHTTAIPDPADPDYLIVTQSQNAGQEAFNGLTRATINVEVSGKTVVLDALTPKYGSLHTRFHDRPDVKALTIYAETVIVRSALHLPGTNVTVYARRLRFENPSGPSLIDTTPIGYSTRAAQYQDGAGGQKGGDITLHVDSFYSEPGQTVRLVTRGGPGQDAGEGRPGSPKPPMWSEEIWNWGGRAILAYPFRKQGWGWINGVPGNTSARVVSITHSATWCQFRIDGSQQWPADGENGVPPGIPGTGGAGGAVAASTTDVASFSQMSGGLSGQRGSPQPGGPPQEPSHAIWVKSIDGSRCTDDYFNFALIGEHWSQPGAPAPAVAPAQPQGLDGSFVNLGGSTKEWLHPYALRMIIAHARDAYRTGNLSYARGVFQDYFNLIDAIGTEGTPSPALELGQARDELQTLLHRLASNLDYFGNGAGFAPPFSLESTMSLFKAEVEEAVPLLSLARWLRAKAEQNLTDINATQDAIRRLGDEATSGAAKVNEALQGAPGIQFQAEQINAQLQGVQLALQEREAQLLQRAKDNIEDQRRVPSWKKTLRVIGTVAQTIPAYQPALGTIGAGLTFISNVDPSKPLESIQQAPDLTSLFKKSTWTASEKNYNDFLKTVDFRSVDNAKFFANELKGAYKEHAALIKETMGLFANTQISDRDIQAEFDRIKAEDSLFNDLIQQTSELQTKKALFAQAVANTLQAISSGSATIGKDLASIASLHENIDTTVPRIDHGMVGYVGEMERRARERLLRYQYFMAKAYEYRMLRPYPGDLNVDSVVNKIMSVMAQDGYAITSTHLEEIKATYLESLRQIVSTALDQLAQQPPERSLPFFFNLSAAELQELNQRGEVAIDLTPRIEGLPFEQNRHIANIVIENMGVQLNGPVGPFARMRVIVNHNGESTETLDGRTYRFHVGNSSKERPMTWGASDNLPGGPLSQENPSLAGISLLQTLLNIQGPIDPLVLFARPGADATVTLMKFPSPTTLAATITSLQVSVVVDFFRGSNSGARLTVRPTQGASPYIAVAQPDVTGRRDGIGRFARTFVAGEPITVTADSTYGNRVFARWVDDTGRVLSTSPTLHLNMASDRTIEPVYVPKTTMQVTSGGGQSTTVGQPFPSSLRVVLTDVDRNPVPGIPVTFSAPAADASALFANGFADISIVSDENGVADSGALTANADAGTFVVAAAAIGATPSVSFQLTNGASSTQLLGVVWGDKQIAQAGAALSQPIVIAVMDTHGRPAAGIPVSLRPSIGGSVPQAALLTDAAGLVTTSWTLGYAKGRQSLTARLSSHDQAVAFAVATIDPPGADALRVESCVATTSVAAECVVRLQLASTTALTSLQFSIRVLGLSGAPAVTEPPGFVNALSTAAFVTNTAGVDTRTVIYTTSRGISAHPVGSVLLGSMPIALPAGAVGHDYSIVVSGVEAIGADGVEIGVVADGSVLSIGGPANPPPDPTTPPPAPPTGLQAAITNSIVTLNWTPAAAQPGSGHRIEVGSFPGSANLGLVSTEEGVTSRALEMPTGVYYVRVRTVSNSALSEPSNEVVVIVGDARPDAPPPCTGAPSAPADLRFRTSGSSVTLEWGLSGGAPTSYALQVGSSAGQSDLLSRDLQSAVPAFVAPDVPAGRYFMRVLARNACATSEPSNEVVVVIGGSPSDPQPCLALAAPSNVQASVTGSAVVLTWADVPNAASYVIEAGTAPGAANLPSIQSATARFMANGAARGTYYVRVRARNPCSLSEPSGEIVVVVR